MTQEEVMIDQENNEDLDDEQVKKPKLRWLPLESNPDVSLLFKKEREKDQLFNLIYLFRY